jgi:hypothetical protein
LFSLQLFGQQLFGQLLFDMPFIYGLTVIPHLLHLRKIMLRDGKGLAVALYARIPST